MLQVKEILRSKTGAFVLGIPFTEGAWGWGFRKGRERRGGDGKALDSGLLLSIAGDSHGVLLRPKALNPTAISELVPQDREVKSNWGLEQTCQEEMRTAGCVVEKSGAGRRERPGLSVGGREGA